MKCIVAVTSKNIKYINKKTIIDELNMFVEEIYYKQAIIDALKQERAILIFDKSIDENITIKEIERIMKLSNDNSILIIDDKYRDTDILNYYLGIGIYNIVFEEDLDTEYIISLLNKKRSYEEAQEYYCIEEVEPFEEENNSSCEKLVDDKSGIKKTINKIYTKLNWKSK